MYILCASQIQSEGIYIYVNLFAGSYNKFFSFLLTDYTRVVAFDSDGFAFADLDHLFLLRMPPGVRVAAPQAYWLRGDGVVVGDVDNCPSIHFPH